MKTNWQTKLWQRRRNEWVFLDAEGTPFYWAVFKTEEHARLALAAWNEAVNGERYTVKVDRMGGKTLTDAATGTTRYLQPGDDAQALADDAPQSLLAEYFASGE